MAGIKVAGYEQHSNHFHALMDMVGQHAPFLFLEQPCYCRKNQAGEFFAQVSKHHNVDFYVGMGVALP